MKYILILIIGFILTGCVTQNKCNRKFPPETIVEYRDTIIKETLILIHDSIVKINLPKDTVYITKFIKVGRNGIINIDTIIVEEGIVGAKAWITKNKLGVVAYVSDSTIFYELDSARITINSYEKEISSKEEIKIIKKPYTPWWIKAVILLLLLISLTLLLLYVKEKIF